MFFSKFRTFTASKCGHRTKKRGKVEAFGVPTVIEMPLNKEKGIDWCLECIGNMTIQCAWCADPIFIGNPITLYTPNEKFEIPEHAVYYSEDPIRLVGCLGWDCALTGAHRSGIWMPGDDGNGHVHQVPSALEIILASGGTKGVLINDTHDINEAMNPTIFPKE